MPIDPLIKRAQREARRVAGKTEKEPEGWREQALRVDTAMAARHMAPAPDVAIEDVMVEVPARDPVRVRLYRPEGATGMLPALLAFFGGSFRQGGLHFPSVDVSNRTRAAAAGIVVAAIDYGLAPENRYPVPVEQGYAALRQLADHGAEHGVDPDRLAIGGMSSGGDLAAAVTLRNRDEARVPLRLQLLEVPVLDLTGGHFEIGLAWRLGLPAPLVKRGLHTLGRNYLGDEARAVEPYASPLLARDLSGLPPAHILTAEYDILRGDGEAYAVRLRETGGEAWLTRYPGQTHESSFYTADLEGARQWQRDVLAVLRTLHD